MRLTVHRFSDNGTATLSLVKLDRAFFCFGLEDPYRETKVPGITRIPAGLYPVKVRKFGGFHARYGQKFGAAHRGMLEICDIPDFSDVLIHIGNTHKHTAGCLLVGEGVSPGSHIVQASTPAYTRLYAAVIDAAEAGDLSIEFIDGDRA